MGGVAARGQQAKAAPNNLPYQLTSFVGREADLRSLKGQLTTTRMVTLVGTGGAGKSRLAAELAKATLDQWPDGIWWIELAATESDVGGTVVANLELPGRGSPQQVVTSWLASRHALLILDNCEHLIAECAAFARTLLESCPQVSILATSREPMGVPGEVHFPVTSLGDPDALSLFEARARLVLPDFTVAPPNREPVSAICERLDRLPLAIEMAAARLDLMSERELLANLNDRFQLLASGTRAGPERQQTMMAAIDWSYRLLNEEEARLFRRLAVFQGGFTMEAAKSVCAEAENVLGLVSALAKKSMVVVERLHDGRTRYRLLESQHDFADEKLAESGDQDATQRRHYDYFRSRKWEPLESANFWHAVSWARDNAEDRGLGLALEIGDADFSNQTRAGNLIHDLLENSKPDETLHAKALIMTAQIAWRRADLTAHREFSEAAVAMAQKVGDPDLIARTLISVGIAYKQTGELALAAKMYDEARELLSASTNRRLADDVSNSRGILAIEQGDPATALEMLTTCVASARSQGELERMARYLESLANAQLDLGNLDGAAASWTESLSIFRDVNDWFGIIWAIGGLSLVAAARHEDERALRLAAAADRLSRQYSLGAWRFRVDQLDTACRKARARVGSKSRGEAAWTEGQTMTTAEAIDYALSGPEPAPAALPDVGPLSRREREVVVMIAAGMTNKQIAQRLFIAERTAEGHVERIRNKLGLRSRTEVATWAVTHGFSDALLDKPPPASKV